MSRCILCDHTKPHHRAPDGRCPDDASTNPLGWSTREDRTYTPRLARGGPVPRPGGRMEPEPDPTPDLPVAYRSTAWEAATRRPERGTAPEVYVAVRGWVTGVEHDVEYVEEGTGIRRPIRGRAWVTLTTEYGETFRIPAETSVVLA